jgi:hypothetical protein
LLDDGLHGVSSFSVISPINLGNVFTVQMSEEALRWSSLDLLYLGSFKTNIIPWKDPVAWLSANTNYVHDYVWLALPHRENGELARTLFDTTPIYQVN